MSIVQFPPRQPEPQILLWRCACGCSTHYARCDGTLECANCGTLQSGSPDQWRSRLPETPSNPASIEGGDVNVVSLDTSAAALKRVVQNIDQRDLAALIVVRNDGGLSTWSSGFSSPDEISWFERRMADAMELMLPKSPPPEEA